MNIELFNEPNCYREGTGNRSKEWTDKRILLFNKFCSASLKNQTAKFTWLVLIDPNTEKSSIDLMKGNFELIIGRGPELIDKIIQMIRSSYHGDGPIITTNLDADDAISSKFLEIIQDNAIKYPRTIYIQEGYKLLLPYNVYIGWLSDINPFVSFIEPNDSNLKTVISYSHGDCRKVYPTVILGKGFDCSYLQVIHGENNSSHIRQGRQDKYKRFDSAAKSYGLDPKDFICPLKEDKKGFISLPQ